MSRKDYELIAAAFRQEAEEWEVGNPGLTALRAAAGRLARMLELDNPRFDRARFLRACGF